MFFLWTGVMAGMLLAYLVMRYTTRSDLKDKSLWDSLRILMQSKRWTLAAVVALLLFIPVPWQFIETGFFGLFGPLEAFKTVLLPWFAGVGFGFWIYVTINPLQAGSPQSGQPAETADAGAPPDGPPSGGNGSAGGEQVRRELSFIPIAVAMLAVAFIITDHEFSWLARLQKLSFGGSGLEFTPRSSGGQEEAVRSSQSDGGGNVIGEDRVSALVGFMAGFGRIIGRDRDYFNELGNGTYDPKQDVDMANNVVIPIGQHLAIFHRAHAYNNLGLLIDRDFVDAIRSFARYEYESGVPAETKDKLAENIRTKISDLWKDLCQKEENLPHLITLKPDEVKTIESCKQTQQSMNDWLQSKGRTAAFSYTLPYGTLFAAMLLNAEGELDSAIKDLDEWVAHQSVSEGNPAADPGESWLVFRTLNQAMQLLLAGDRSTSNSYLALGHARKLAQIGQALLESDAKPTADSSTKLSWRAQNAKLAKAEPVDLLWELGYCPGDLSASFKRAKLATVQASNNVAFILSQNIEYAERQDWVSEMERRANDIATKVNARCLAAMGSDQKDIERAQAAFFDTAATVQFTLAERETQLKEKRHRLCDAYKYISKAVRIQFGTVSRESLSAPRPSDPGPFRPSPDRAEFMKQWTEYRQETIAHNRLAAYDHLQSEINSQLAQIGYTNADCS